MKLSILLLLASSALALVGAATTTLPMFSDRFDHGSKVGVVGQHQQQEEHVSFSSAFLSALDKEQHLLSSSVSFRAAGGGTKLKLQGRVVHSPDNIGYTTFYTGDGHFLVIHAVSRKAYGSLRVNNVLYNMAPSTLPEADVVVKAIERSQFNHHAQGVVHIPQQQVDEEQEGNSNRKQLLHQRRNDTLLFTFLVVVPATQQQELCLDSDAEQNREVYARAAELSLDLVFNYADDHSIRSLGYVRCIQSLVYGDIADDLALIRDTTRDPGREILTYRNDLEADLVSMSHDQPGGYGYYGYDGAGEANGYSTIWEEWAVGNYGYAHEMGHNLGLNHDRANSGVVPGRCNYGSYLQDQDNLGDQWRGWRKTVMAYGFACDNCPIWPVFAQDRTMRDAQGREWGPWGFDCQGTDQHAYPPGFGNGFTLAADENQLNFIKNIKTVAQYRGPPQEDWEATWGCTNWDPHTGCDRP